MLDKKEVSKILITDNEVVKDLEDLYKLHAAVVHIPKRSQSYLFDLYRASRKVTDKVYKKLGLPTENLNFEYTQNFKDETEPMNNPDYKYIYDQVNKIDDYNYQKFIDWLYEKNKNRHFVVLFSELLPNELFIQFDLHQYELEFFFEVGGFWIYLTK